jgi:tagatose-1,6-bisphosphate aldolase non-catalytic subunit AgaZ/GatZ
LTASRQGIRLYWTDQSNRIAIEFAMTNRKMYNTTIDANLIRQIKILAAQLEKRQNDLLEEAIEDLLRKYETRAEA